MADFSEQVNDFVFHGTYGYKFDEIGNVILNPSSSVFQEHYELFYLTNATYDENKINMFYDTEFTEFQKPVSSSVSSSVETQRELDSVKQENESLRSQLDTIIGQSEQNSTAADNQATKDIILELRILLGQGKVETDFESDFPYLPKDITDIIQ